MKENKVNDILLLNLGMMMVGTSGLLGRYIDLAPGKTTFLRASLAMIVLGMIVLIRRKSLRLNGTGSTRRALLGGIFMAAHWVTYFYSLQLSNVAIGMLSLFTYPVITSFLEPVFLKVRFQWRHLPIGIITLAGLYILYPGSSDSAIHWAAIPLGLLSALVYACRNLLMKGEIVRQDGIALMFWQLLGASFVLLVFLDGDILSEFGNQWQPLLFLAIVTTVAGHTLFLISLRNFTVTTASILSCSQPLYGIFFGWLILGENPVLTTWIGGSLILLSVVAESLLHNRTQ